MDAIGAAACGAAEVAAAFAARLAESGCAAGAGEAARRTARAACVAEIARRLTGLPPLPLPEVDAAAALLHRHRDLVDRLSALPLPAASPGRSDVVTPFCERFLAEAAPDERTRRGAFFTPAPVARFIVRSVGLLLERELRVEGGLSGLPTGTRILDPAAGSGVFLRAAVEAAVARSGREGAGRVAAKLVGVDLDPAALAACAASLGETAAWCGADARPRLVLGDVLAEPHALCPEVARLRAGEPVPVVIGNPPYLGHSANRGRWIRELLAGCDEAGAATASYLSCEGRPLGERNAKWLNDDYVKFLRFAHWRIERTGWGVIGFVVNHGFLDGTTFRGLRESLVRAFDSVHVLDLHGNANRRERSPSGGPDQNVFPIRQGVAILLLTWRPGTHPRSARVYHGEIWGRRDDAPGRPGKYAWLDGHDVGNVAWTAVRPESPFYLFAPRRRVLDRDYEAGFPLDRVFPVHSLGITAGRDRLCIQFSRDDMIAAARLLTGHDVETARDRLGVGPDGSDWRLADAREDLLAHPECAAAPVPIAYRPFDTRWTIYTGRSRGFLCRPRRQVMDHLAAADAPALLFGRAVETPDGWSHVLAVRGLCQLHAVALKEVNQVAPFHLRDPLTGLRRPNLAPEWIDAVAAATGLRWGEGKPEDARFSAAEMFGYLYAVLHAPSYRRRHAEALRHGYPRVPVPTDAARFLAVAGLGNRLLDAHLHPERQASAGRYVGSDAPVVVGVRREEGTIRFADDGRFDDVPEAAWRFRIGDYQVCRRWLLDRRGRRLTAVEREAYRHVVGAVAATLELAPRIDAVLAGTVHHEPIFL